MSAPFPKMTSSARSGEAGVNLVASAITELGWIFRRSHGEHDFGIDGYVDLVTPDGLVTGRCLALQVKHGPSYFAHKTNDGIVYYGERRHLNYFMNHPVPVLIVLCDPGTKKCYWTPFRAEAIEPTDTGWKLCVPFSNALDAQSTDLLAEAAGPPRDYSSALEHYWAVNKAIGISSLIFYNADRIDIEQNNEGVVVDFFQRLQRTSEFARASQGKVELVISGYDDDPRELWEIPEVVRWVRNAELLGKYWFFFLTPVWPARGLATLIYCSCGASWVTLPPANSTGSFPIKLDEGLLGEFLRRNFAWLNEIAELLRLSESEIERISMDIIEYITAASPDTNDV
ncbi:DUF4365 and DUF1817 domain-containing protein [Sorangium sp. So ce375]|uniref:DUF4365 domain-containing protein n=1 Tax=Sorangium sp. So ce375 TaxID=3133306 RepID=UPI003F5B2A06